MGASLDRTRIMALAVGVALMVFAVLAVTALVAGTLWLYWHW